MGRPRLHDEATRKNLLRAGAALVAKEGANAVSVRRIADAAGTSTRAVYSVFGGKKGLIAALCREGFVELLRAVEKLPRTGDPARDLVRAGIGGFRRFALAQPDLFHFVFERLQRDERTPADLAVGGEALAMLRDRVQRLADAGLLADHSVELAATAFHALCQGLVSMELQERRWDSRSPEVVWEEALTALVEGLGQPRRKR